VDLAWRAGRLLFSDDLRHLCGAGHLFDHRSKKPWCEPQPHLVHHLVKRRARLGEDLERIASVTLCQQCGDTGLKFTEGAGVA
jgi:hypothetical protein